MTVKKKTTTKKTTVKKATRKKTVSAKAAVANEDSVMSHNPLAMLDDEVAESLAAVADSPAQEQSMVEVLDEMAADRQQSEQPTQINAGEIKLGDSLTIADAEGRKAEFLALLSAGTAVTLDGSEIEQLDGAGLQLLAAFYKDSVRKGVEISWSSISRSFDDTATLLGMKTALGLQDVTVEDDGEGVSWGLF